MSNHNYIIVDRGEQCLLIARQAFAFSNYSYPFELGESESVYYTFGRIIELPADEVAEKLNKYNKQIIDMRD